MNPHERPDSAPPPETDPAVRTFLIADIRGYTHFTLKRGDEVAARLAARFAAICREVVHARGGRVLELRGDEALAVFSSVRQALRAAVDLQQQCREQSAADATLPLNVGIGLDAGEAVAIEGGFRGTALNLAARLCARAEGGQILATDTVVTLARQVDDIGYEDRGLVSLKGFEHPVSVVEVIGSKRSLRREVEPVAGAAPMHLPTGRFLGALPDGRLIARLEEVARLEKIVQVVSTGSGQLVVLAGEPGVGKTRLAQELTVHLRERGFLVCTGRCYESSQGVPYFPFLEALATAYAIVPPEVRDLVPQRWPYFGLLLPDLVTPPAVNTDSQEEQQRLFRTITGFLHSAAETAPPVPDHPVALLLDDLHWADESSLALLQHLARNTRQCPVLLVGTYRDVEINPDHPLERFLLDLGRERLVERISVRRLPQDGTAGIVRDMLELQEVSSDLAQLIHGHTEGNPFFVEEVVHALIESGDLYQKGESWGRRPIAEITVPESVRSVIGQRVGRMTEPAQDLLLRASVLGQTFRFDTLVDVDGHTEDEVEGLLEEALHAGIVQETGRDRYAFNHALTQQSLYARLPSRRRRRLHLAAGEAIERLGNAETRAAELAWHFLEGDEPKLALRYSLQAGDHAEEVFAHGEAERHFRTGLELAGEVGDWSIKAHTLHKLGLVLSITARYNEAIKAFEAAASLYAELGDLHGEILAHVRLGQTLRGTGQAARGIELVTSVLTRVEAMAADVDIGELLVVLETLYFVAGRYADGLRTAERAAELARTAGNVQLLARAEVSRGTQLQMLGRPIEGTRVLEEAISLAENYTSSPDDLTRADNLTRALVNISSGYVDQGRLREALRSLERALSLLERTENPWPIAFTISNLGSVHRIMGAWNEARRYLDRGEMLSRQVPNTWWSAYPLLEYAALCVDTGELERASSYLADVLGSEREDSDMQASRFAYQIRADVELLHGRPLEALAHLRRVLDPDRMGEKQLVRLLPTYAAAQLEAGDLSGAARTLDTAEEEALAMNGRLDLAAITLVRGRLQAARAQWEDAEITFGLCRSEALEMPYPHLAANALYYWGLMGVVAGQPVVARRRLETARDEFTALGAMFYADRAAAALETGP